MTLYNGPIVDSHIHLFDPRRPQGIPWPSPGDVRFQPSLPEHYRPLAGPHGVVRAIVVEASPWHADNHWLAKVLHDAATDQDHEALEIVGYVGNLNVRDPLFLRHLAELSQSRYFVGIRFGNLWDRDPLADAQQAECIAALRALAASGRSLDSANPDPSLIKSLLLITDAIPELTVVVDHLPNAMVANSERAAYERDLRELAGRSTVFAKLSEIPQSVDGKTQLSHERYQALFDTLSSWFGEDRILFGSDWPNSDALASFHDTVTLTKQLMHMRSATACAKFFAENAARAYRFSG